MSDERFIRDMYAHSVKEDWDAVRKMLPREFEWRTRNCLPYGGSYRGVDGVIEYGTKAATYHDYIGVDVVLRQGDEDRYDVRRPLCQFWTFRDGQAVAAEYWNDSGAVLRELAEQPASTAEAMSGRG